MFTVEEGSRRATLKGCGFIQVFLGVTTLPAAIAALVMQSSTDTTYSGIWSSLLYIILGAVCIQCARFDSTPSRGMLNACIGLNIFVLVISVIAVAILIWAAVQSTVGGVIAVAVIPLVAVLLVTITATVYASRIKSEMTSTGSGITPSVQYVPANHMYQR